MPRRRHLLLLASLVVVATAAAVTLRPEPGAGTEPLPGHLSDQAFWQMVTSFSEPGGFFRSDNLISNEIAFQQVIPDLRARTTPVGAYIGVGPDQNFTYIAALEPKIAFIVDIRRQNMLLHLMYKAIIEASADRADFLSRLFSRPRPSGLGAASTAPELLAAYALAPPNADLFHDNLRRILDRLRKRHHFTLDDEDARSLEYVYTAFFTAGPELRYSFPRGYGGRWFPTYAELMTESDGRGGRHSYLADEAHFRVLKTMEQNNLLVPIVGDFAGDKALREVGRYLRAHGAAVTIFYTSNVEQYLFQSDGWRRFFDNVAALPLDARSTFIRAFFNRGFRFQPSFPDARSATLTDPIADALADVKAGRIQTYYDLIDRSK